MLTIRKQHCHAYENHLSVFGRRFLGIWQDLFEHFWEDSECSNKRELKDRALRLPGICLGLPCLQCFDKFVNLIGS